MCGIPLRRDQRLAHFEADGILSQINRQASLEDVNGLVRAMDVERRHLAVGQLALDHDCPAAVHGGSLHRSQRLHQAASPRFEVGYPNRLGSGAGFVATGDVGELAQDLRELLDLCLGEIVLEQSTNRADVAARGHFELLRRPRP